MVEQQGIVQHFRLRPDYVDVEVTGILTAEGKPVVVRLHRPDARELFELLKVAPGAAPERVADGEELVEEESNEDRVYRLSTPLLERWASVRLPNGEWARPAFSFDENGNHGGLLPGDALTYVDRAGLGLRLLQLGGYAGGAATDTFLGQ